MRSGERPIGWRNELYVVRDDEPLLRAQENLLPETYVRFTEYGEESRRRRGAPVPQDHPVGLQGFPEILLGPGFVQSNPIGVDH